MAHMSIFLQMPMETLSFIFFYSLFSFSVFEFSTAFDTITPNQSIITGETLVSSGQTFELGFFYPGAPKNRYLGIWYKSSPQTVVWVANRENPLTDSNGSLTISSDGNLVILNSTKAVVWSSSSLMTVQNSVAQLLDSGNLVLREKGDWNTENYIWQSFDFPSDTQLPGMKLGWNLSSGLNRYLTSWRDANDPSPGEYTYRFDNLVLPQIVLRKGSEKKFRTGTWNGLGFSGMGTTPNPIIDPTFVFNTDELFYMYKPTSDSMITRLVLNQSGMLQRFALNAGNSEWALIYAVQNDLCDDYGKCGPNGICRINRRPICECLEGFIPKSQKEWDFFHWSNGCVRRTPLNCQKREGFLQLSNMKLPDVVQFWLNKSMGLNECKTECLKNCSCIAYANSDISRGGSGCLLWFGDLIDIREFLEESRNQDIYIRMPASELGHNQKEKRLVEIVAISTVLGMLVLGLFTCFIIWKRRKTGDSESTKEDIELPFFDLATIATATKNFSSTNMIGEGGFGPVYKGKLSMGQEIAVKRLSNNSGQGFQEFKNEVIMISKLQHRNLVRLLGCCSVGEERMLVYEHMTNGSLDSFIFDQDRRMVLTWQKRFDIAMGIARGLLYLHQDSRLRIIHRDLKASNILLDSELNPKISDFGIAKIFGRDQIEAKTKRIIGTYGYMSPEYAVDGKFSVKSDVFSLGVLLLEIVSGKKNRKFHHPDHHHNLLGHAWLLWNEDKALELMDSCLKDSYVESQIERCIQVGLLCVQKLPGDRPAMSSVVFMLGNEGLTLPQPKQPGFFIERSTTDTEDKSTAGSEVTFTMPEAR